MCWHLRSTAYRACRFNSRKIFILTFKSLYATKSLDAGGPQAEGRGRMEKRWAQAPAARHQQILLPQSLDDAVAPGHVIRTLEGCLLALDSGVGGAV